MFRKVTNIDRIAIEVQPLKYNSHRVYESSIGSYLYYVFYEDIDTGRWQGSQNDQFNQSHL